MNVIYMCRVPYYIHLDQLHRPETQTVNLIFLILFHSHTHKHILSPHLPLSFNNDHITLVYWTLSSILLTMKLSENFHFIHQIDFVTKSSNHFSHQQNKQRRHRDFYARTRESISLPRFWHPAFVSMPKRVIFVSYGFEEMENCFRRHGFDTPPREIISRLNWFLDKRYVGRRLDFDTSYYQEE